MAVNISGPFSDHSRREQIFQMMRQEILVRSGSILISEWQQLLDRYIKHPTPYYETQIRVVLSENQVSVNDRGVIYGPWLEGTSRLNRTTSFRGYHARERAEIAARPRIRSSNEQITDAVARMLGG